jgi:hypothetical protein
MQVALKIWRCETSSRRLEGDPLSAAAAKKTSGQHEVPQRNLCTDPLAEPVRVTLVERTPADRVGEIQRLLRQVRQPLHWARLDLSSQISDGIGQHLSGHRL